MKTRKMKEKGITLIALVVTIVILLILAGVSITVVFGDNGIIKMAQEAVERTRKEQEEELKNLGELESWFNQSEKKITIRLVGEQNEVITNCNLNVYTDEQCQNFLKTIEIRDGQAENSQYSYESDDVLADGVYYIKVESIAEPYRINPGIFKFEVVNEKNMLQIKFNKYNGNGMKLIESYGDKIYLNDNIHVKLTNINIDDNATVLLEPIAQYDETKSKYVALEKFANADGLKQFLEKASYNETGLGDFDFSKVNEETYNFMQNNNYQYSISISGNVKEGISTDISAKYAYLIKPLDIDMGDDIYMSGPMILFPILECKEYLMKNYDVALSYEYESKFTNMKIISNIGNNYASADKPITFVYRINVNNINTTDVYSNIVIATAKGDGQMQTTTNSIMSGTQATVTLEYCSNGFTPSNGTEKKVIVKPDGTTSVHFDFVTTNSTVKTGAISNIQFEADGTGGWYNTPNCENGKIKLETNVSNMTVHLTAQNLNTENCYIRVKSMFPSNIEATHQDKSEGEVKWIQKEDGYWYYKTPLTSNATTEVIDIKLNVPEELEQDSFNIGTIVEYVPANGNQVSGWLY